MGEAYIYHSVLDIRARSRVLAHYERDGLVNPAVEAVAHHHLPDSVFGVGGCCFVQADKEGGCFYHIDCCLVGRVQLDKGFTVLIECRSGKANNASSTGLTSAQEVRSSALRMLVQFSSMSSRSKMD